MRIDLRIALFAALCVAACTPGLESDELPAIVRASPVRVSDPAAWRLFDRSAASAYLPGAAPVVVGFDGAEALATIKVLGPAPYLLHVRNADGGTLGWEPVDLRSVDAGWHAFLSGALVETREVQLRFESTGGAGPVPELELWSVASGAGAVKLDPTAAAPPRGLVSFPSSLTGTLAPGDCAAYPIEVARPPSQLRRAHLVFLADGLFRPFSLRHAVNGRAPAGGSWLAADPGERTFVEEIDPATLAHGINEVRLCLPDVAPTGVQVSQVRIVGELDRGVGLAARVTIGSSEPDGAALIDGDAATELAIGAGEPIMVGFDRLIAPDALVATGAGDAVPRVQCIDRNGAAIELAADRTGGALRLEGGACACAALGLAFDTAVVLGDLDVIGSGAGEPVDWPRVIVTSRPEHFGDVAWVGGFTALPPAMTGPVRLAVAGQAADGLRGDFGRLLSRTDDPSTAWTVGIDASFPGGAVDHRTIVLDRDARADLAEARADAGQTQLGQAAADPRFGAAGDEVAVRVTATRAQSIRLGTHAGVEVPAGAVTRSTTITARHLGDAVVPPLDPGMINVTAPRGHGYEFLPHGQRFARPVAIDIPFEPRLVPAEMTADDVHTYYHDPKARRWRPLDRTSIDVGSHVIRSSTRHFTIMINAVLATPTNPAPLAFDPTTLSSIAAASPAAEIDLIEPPAATSTGDAQLGLPIRLPAGRGAYSPALAIRYSSSAGNGWLGVGWDVSMSRIAIDTRWGVPTYADGEEPRYELDGAELVPTLDADGPTCAGGRRYHARVEGAFAHILRCGTSPADYHFEVRDRDGTRFVYGSDVAGNPGNPSIASTKDRPCGSPPCGQGIFRWNLRRVEDTFGNATTYGYQVDTVAGPEPAREVYPQSIAYASHPSKPARYAVDFILDGGDRPDRIVSGRGGFKATTRRLLRSVRVRLDAEVIREYVLTYAHGQFDKSALESVRVYGVGGCAAGSDAFALPTCGSAGFLDDHTFEYLAEATGFTDTEAWYVFGDPDPGKATLGRGDATTYAASLSLRAKIETSPPPDPISASAGVSAHGSMGSRGEKTGIYDVNGDGLADQVFHTSGGLVILYNLGEQLQQFSPLGPAVSGLDALGQERQQSWGVDANAGVNVGNFGASASGGMSNATSRAIRILTDVDGDGFLDQARAGGALFSGPCSTGHCFLPGTWDAASAIDPGADPLLGQFDAEIEERMVLGDPVVQWIAPYTGTVTLTGEVALVDTSPVDGVAVEIVHDDLLLGGWSVADPATPLSFYLPGVEVTAGEAVYLRVSTAGAVGITNNVLHDEVAADLVASYVLTCADASCSSQVWDAGLPSREPTGERVFTSVLSEELRVVAVRPYQVPLEGVLALKGRVLKAPSAAPIRYCLQRFAPGSELTDFRCDDGSSPATIVYGPITYSQEATVDQVMAPTFPVEPGTLLVLRAESDWSIDPASIRFAPDTVAYLEACIPDESGTGCAVTSVPEELADIPLDKSSLGFFVAPVSPAEPDGAVPLPFVAPETGHYTFYPFPNPLGNVATTVGVRTNLQGTMRTIDCLAMCNFEAWRIRLTAGESLSIEVVADPLVLPPLAYTVPLQHGDFIAVPLIFRQRYPAPVETGTPFVGTYQGWRVTLWNEKFPFEPARLLADIATLDDHLLPRLLEIGLSAFAPVPAFGGVPYASVLEPAWVGYGSPAFVTESGRMNAARLGRLGPPVPGEPQVPDGGLFAGDYVRLSGTRSYYAGAGIDGGNVMSDIVVNPSLSGTASRSTTRTTTDVLDMTGDGVADVVAADRFIQGSLSGAPSAPGTTFQFGDGFRRRASVDYSFGMGVTATSPTTSAAGRALRLDRQPLNDTALGFSSSTGLAVGRSETTEDLVDVNGDGLPDLVQRSGTVIRVRYNLGTSLGAWEDMGTLSGELATAAVDGFQAFEDAQAPSGLPLSSTTDALSHDIGLTQHRTYTFDAWFVSYSYTKRTTSCRTTRQFQDLNGDGLPDLLLKLDGEPIQVQFNRGGDFAPQTTWTTPDWTVFGAPLELAPGFHSKFDSLLIFGPNLISGPDVLAGTSSQTSVTHSGGVQYNLYKGDKASVGIGGTISRARDTDTYELALVDVTGDGAADHVFRRGQSNNPDLVYIKRNQQTGRSNFLHRVRRPLGGTITLGYTSAGNTVDLPQRRQVLASVEVDDGVDLGPAFASPHLVTTFSYEGGKYERYEKELFGFAKVITLRPDGGTLEQQFHNDSFALRGRLLQEIRRDSAGAIFGIHEVEYEVQDVLGPSDTPVALDAACVPKPRVGPASCTPRFPIVVREVDIRSEGGADKKKRVTLELTRDRFGNPTASSDAGDDALVQDDIAATAQYTNDLARWILGRPILLEVHDHTGTLVRSRTGTYGAEGALASLGVDTGAGTATTTLEHDVFGNVTAIELPPNEDSEVQRYEVTFDAAVATYPVAVADAFGHASTAEYDLRFGVATLETDVNGVQLERTLDAFGRLATVRGPYDGGAPALAMSYFPQEIHPRAVAVTTPSAPGDYTGSLPPALTTVMIADGLGRPIELRKTAAVDGATGMTTSGVVARDALGRVVTSYQPFFTPGAGTGFVPPAVTLATTTSYDALDRAVTTLYPDGATEATSFTLQQAPIGALLFRTQHTDPNGKQRETFTDHAGQTRVFVEHPDSFSSSITTYDYRPTGELAMIVDAEGTATELGYDLRGLRTTFNNPDTGLITDRFDLAGNRVATIEPNHAALGAEVRFHYDRDRLESIVYPSKPAVTFTYGAPGAPLGRAGRLAIVADETGTQEYSYGALGEVRRSLRTVVPLSGGTPLAFDLRTTTDSLGRPLEVRYPDGERVTNVYNAGGLASVTGAGAGWSQTYAGDIRYDVFGHRTGLTFGNGVVTTWSYEPPRVRLSTVTTTLPSAQEIQHLRFTYDPGSNPIKVDNTLALPADKAMPGASSLKLSYDGVDRLVQVGGWAQLNETATTEYQQAFGYSPSHNLVHKDRNHLIDGLVVPATSFDHDYVFNPTRPHLPAQVGAIAIAYDASGNPTSRVGPDLNQTLVWDDDNRLVEVSALQSRYDSGGLRVLRLDSATERQTVFSSPYFDLDGAQGIKHVFAGELRVASAFSAYDNVVDPPAPPAPSVPYYLHADHLGSTAVVSDQTGAVHQSTEYFVDGETWIDRAPAETVNGYLFNGKPFDPQTGFYDYGQRFYDPRTSLFLGIDPALVDGPKGIIGVPGMLAPLGYAAHSPVRLIDPDGRQPADPLVVDHYNRDRLADAEDHGVPPDVALHPLQAESHRVRMGVLADVVRRGQPMIWAGQLVPGVDAAVKFGMEDYEGAAKSAAFDAATFGVAKLLGLGVKVGARAAGPVLRWLFRGGTKAVASGGGLGFRSFSALKRVLGPTGPKMEWHHIVGQTSGNTARFGATAIHNTSNIVALPQALHRKVSALYSSIRPRITGSNTLTVRQWLSTQSFQQQQTFGKTAVEKLANGAWP